MNLSSYQVLEHIFIGSSIMLSLMCFAWSGATRRFSVVTIALYFLMRSLGLLSDIHISVLTLFTKNINLLKTELTFYTIVSSLILTYFVSMLLDKDKVRCRRFLQGLSVFILLMLVVNYYVDVSNLWLFNQFIMMITYIVLITIVILQKMEESDILKLFLATLLVQFAFSIIYVVLFYLNVSPLFINVVEMMSFVLIVTFVTYMVGRNYFFYVEDEKLTHEKLVESMQVSEKAKEELLRIQQENQEQLESNVQERTIELNIALQELEEANHELREKNTLDELTGLYNRRFYDQKILAEFRRSRRNLTPLSLIVVDIDHFKNVNDSYGHLAGDKCLVKVAEAIKLLLQRSGDVGCRYGGEEFCLILPETDQEGAIALAEDIREKIQAQDITINDNVISLSASCGVSTYTQEKNKVPEDIFSSADRALYQAKQAGRNQVKSCEINES